MENPGSVEFSRIYLTMKGSIKKMHVKAKNSMIHAHGVTKTFIKPEFAIIATAMTPIIVPMFHQQVLGPEQEVCQHERQLV